MIDELQPRQTEADTLTETYKHNQLLNTKVKIKGQTGKQEPDTNKPKPKLTEHKEANLAKSKTELNLLNKLKQSYT